MSFESVMLSNHLILCHPLFLPSIFPSIMVFSRVSSSHQVARVLEFQLQHHSFQWTPRTDLLWNKLLGSPCNPRNSQESSPTSQFKSINSWALSFLYSPTLTSIHDYWRCMEGKTERLLSRNTNSTGTVIGIQCHQRRKSPTPHYHKVFPFIISAASFLLE